MFDTNYDYGKGDYTVGYQDDGTFKSAGGTHSLMGTEKDFEALTATNPALAWSIAQQRGRGGFFGLEPDDYDKAKAAAAKASRGDLGLAPKRIDSTNKLIHKSSFSPAGDAGYDTSVPSDAAGAEQGSFGGEGGGYDPSADISFGDEGTSVATSAAASGGEIRMQEGGNVPEMPQQGAEGDMANLGMIKEQAAPPQQGGQQSVKDDVPREADEGDYILPYETVLLVGLKDLNRYAKEAIDLAMKNDVNLTGTDLDPTDDVPIKVSNYEYHIPKVLVPFFGGGKKYLDKIREEGLALRKRLEEEKQPSAQEQQPQVPMQEAPPQMEPQAAPPPEMAQAAPAPQPPMMQRGGFVLSPDEKKQPTTEAMLEADTTQAQESSYNQMQALERTRKQAQQPPMVDPSGKIVQQGFAAPQGYQDGSEVAQTPPIPSRKPDQAPNQTPLKERDYYQNAKRDMELFRRLEPARMMALTAMGEARGEGREGMKAVMHVINNRKKDGRFGSSIADVILQKNAFSAIIPNLESEEAYSGKEYKNFNRMLQTQVKDKNFRTAYEDALKILSGDSQDNTNGSKYYYNPKIVDRPDYLQDKSQKVEIGNHVFFRDGGFVERVVETAA